METTILSVARETPDTVTVRVAAPFSFAPGQFVMLGVRIGEKEVKRSYSVSSKPNGEWVEVTIKRQSPGVFSEAAQHFVAGQRINLYGPFGKHFLFNPECKDVVLLAGGSGISVFRSFIQYALANNHDGKITLLYSVRHTDDIIFKHELEEWKHRGVRVIVSLTRPSEHELENWKGAFGRITGKLLKDTLGTDFSDKEFYVCGPTNMVVDCQTLLASLGIAKEHVHTEKFGMIEG